MYFVFEENCYDYCVYQDDGFVVLIIICNASGTILQLDICSNMCS